MLTAPWIATFPGLAILVTVVDFNLVGDGLPDAQIPGCAAEGSDPGTHPVPLPVP